MTSDTPDLPPPSLRPNLRDQWMLKPGIAFLNHGSFGAIPKAIFDEQNNWRRRIEAEPIQLLGRQNATLIEQAKIPIGKQFGMKPADFGFVTNATEGINAVLRGLKLEPGDELLTTDHVYHAVRQTLRLTARALCATLREVAIRLPVASAGQIADAVLGAVSSKTRLLVIDHITSPTGMVFPIERMVAGCAERGIETLVDGAHAPGMIPLNVEKLGSAYYAANLHKWVCAPKGSAFVWVRPDRQRDVHPNVVSHFLDEGFIREFDWQGTRDISAWLTTPMALKFMGDLDWDAVMDHNHRMAVWAHRMLCRRFDVAPISPLDGSLLGSTASVRLPGTLARLDCKGLEGVQQRLYTQFGVEAPLMRWNEHAMLRVSCQVYNQPEEYERLAEAIESLNRES